MGNCWQKGTAKMISKTQAETEARTQRVQARMIKCHGHFTDIDRTGNCLYCGGKPGGSAVRRTNEDN